MAEGLDVMFRSKVDVEKRINMQRGLDMFAPLDYTEDAGSDSKSGDALTQLIW